MAKAIHFYGSFKGIYEWGHGYISDEKRELWNKFWEEEFPKLDFWYWFKFIPGETTGSCGTLVSILASIYMHPYAIHGILTSTGGHSGCSLPEEKHQYDYTFRFLEPIDQLRQICEACAQYCGSTFELKVTKEFDFDIPQEEFIIKQKTDYLHNCAEKRESPYFKHNS